MFWIGLLTGIAISALFVASWLIITKRALIPGDVYIKLTEEEKVVAHRVLDAWRDAVIPPEDKAVMTQFEGGFTVKTITPPEDIE